jgi:hypothetical protein
MKPKPKLMMKKKKPYLFQKGITIINKQRGLKENQGLLDIPNRKDWTIPSNMAIPVMEFQIQGYKINKAFYLELNVLKERKRIRIYQTFTLAKIGPSPTSIICYI